MFNISSKKPHPYSGLCIVWEGMDGSGKDTQIRKFAERLKKEFCIDVVISREPGETPAGVAIRNQLLEHPLCTETQVLLFAADRCQTQVDVDLPALKEGKVLFKNRSWMSSVAYQGTHDGMSPEQVMEMNKWAIEKLLPDVFILLDVDPKIAMQRIDAGRRFRDVIEKGGSEYFVRVRKGYQVSIDKLSSVSPYTKVLQFMDDSGKKGIDEIHGEIWQELQPVILSWLEKREGQIKDEVSYYLGKER